MGRLGRAIRRERGTTALEYILVLSLVALVVLALTSAGLRTRSTSAVQTAVCNLFSTADCGTAGGPGQPGAGGPGQPGAGGPGQPGGGGAPQADQPQADQPQDGGDDGGGFWGGLADAGGAFVDGLVRGDFNRDDRTDNGWIEGARAVGQFASGILVVGDIRDGGAAIGEIWSSGGRDGWGNLLLSGVGLVPVAGDLIKGVKGGAQVADVVRAADDVPPVRPRDPDAPAARPPDCLTNSFTPATRVLLADGTTLPIAEIDVGDEVLAADPVTGAAGARPVTDLIVGLGVKELVDVSVGGATLTATAGHPFYLPEDGDWVGAGDLQPGDALLTDTGSRVVVEAVRDRRAVSVAHNLTVAELHTYYVLAGDAPVLVHNQSGGPCFPSWGSGQGPRTLPNRAPFDDPAVADGVNATLDRIQAGSRHPHAQDGTVFRNRDELLPLRRNNYYREYTVETPGAGNRGTRRIVVGEQGEVYYSHEHYRDFHRIDPRRAPG